MIQTKYKYKYEMDKMNQAHRVWLNYSFFVVVFFTGAGLEPTGGVPGVS